MQEHEYVDFELPDEDGVKTDQQNNQQEIVKSGYIFNSNYQIIKYDVINIHRIINLENLKKLITI
jgi:hypothetical protein